MRARRKLLGLSMALVVLVAVSTYLVLGRRTFTDPPRPLFHAYYVWQMQWTDSVRNAVAESAPGADRIMVLLGEIGLDGQNLRYTAAQPDWRSLASSRARTTLVLRANAGVGQLLTEERGPESAAYFASVLKKAMATARDAGVLVAGVQLDYDCPSARLGDYRRLLESLRGDLAGTDLSITVLPTWMKRWGFAGLLQGLSYYVLQVHSLEAPSSIDDPIVLCDTARIPAYLRRAGSVGVPFYLALPTYGYRVAFDSEGRFKALSAEGPVPAWSPTYQVKLVMADPAEIAAVVRGVMAAPPRGCRGFAWFRLPVHSDELNWTWPTLQAVSEGRVPVTALTAEVRNPSPGLYEVWLSNAGETRVWKTVGLSVTWTGHRLLAHDVLNGFDGQADAQGQAMRLTGPAPRREDAVMAAWFRTEPERLPAPPVTAGKVEVLE